MKVSPKFFISTLIVFTLFLVLGFHKELSLFVIITCSFIFGMTVHLFVELYTRLEVNKDK
ncbi:hypothetical protein [Alkalihalobacterium elongatum]|uniref:hypothetical protein n=1 Tax=Alkalihalobacterium elongatum TaxID=2675466 RepID=UPI001C1F3DE1|nr:hypothetical protein [Alkalihalobacterium elongatum]